MGTKRIVSDVKAFSGLAWNSEVKKMYFINFCKFTLEEYDWNPNNGEICVFVGIHFSMQALRIIPYFSGNGKVAFNFNANTGISTSAPIGFEMANCESQCIILLVFTKLIPGIS